MARVPEVATAGGVAGAARGALGPSPVVRQPTGEFEALAGVAETFGLQIRADQIARDNIRSVQVQSEAERRIEAGLADLDPLAETYDEDARRVVDEATAEARGNANLITRQVTDDLERRLTALGEGSFTLALRTRRGAIEDQALAVRQEAVDEALADIRADPDATDTYLSRFQGRAERLNAGISKDKIPGLSREFLDATIIAQVEGYALRGDEDSIAQANLVIDANEENLSPAQSRALKARVRQIEDQVKSDRLSDTAREVADLEIGIVLGQKHRSDIDEADARGLFEDREGKRVGLIKLLAARDKENKDKQKAFLEVLDNMAAGRGLDNKAQAELAEESLTADLEKAPPEARREFIRQFANNTGWALPSVSQRFENVERGIASPEQIAEATMDYDALRATNPEAQGMAKVGPIIESTSVRQEFSPGNYLDHARNVVDDIPDPQKLKVRREEFPEKFADFDPLDEVSRATGFDEDLFLADPTRQAVVTYERVFRLGWENTGNADLAKEQANRFVKQSFGPTRLGAPKGSMRIMELPPARFMPAPVRGDLSTDMVGAIVEGDIRRDMERLGIEPAIVIGAEAPVTVFRPLFAPPEAIVNEALNLQPRPTVKDKSGFPDFILVVDKQTRREARQYADDPSAGVSYEVRFRDQNGNHVPERRVNPETGLEETYRIRTPGTMAEIEQNPEFKMFKARGLAEAARVSRQIQRRRAEGRPATVREIIDSLLPGPQ